jgi:hypothetical protein
MEQNHLGGAGDPGDRRWWNGRWGRLARVDVLLYPRPAGPAGSDEDAGRWMVEHRVGGVEGRITVTEFDSRDAAMDQVRDLLAGTDGWREW